MFNINYLDPMDIKLTQTVPSALAGIIIHSFGYRTVQYLNNPNKLGTATGLGYSVDAVSLLTISQYITNLGFTSVASLNDTALSIPYVS